MTTDPCEGCGERVRVAGGIGDMWSAPSPSGGMTIEFADGDEAFLCFSCIDDLPDEPTRADVDGVGDDSTGPDDGAAGDGSASDADP